MTVEKMRDYRCQAPWRAPGTFGRIDVEAEVPILWSPESKSRLIGKDPDAGKD